MRNLHLLYVLGFLASSIGQASTVTIDFEEFAVGESGPLVSNGFVVDGAGSGGYGCVSVGPLCGTGHIAEGNVFRVIGAEEVFSGTVLTATVSRQDGLSFALYSLDLGFDYIEAETASGNFISGLSADVGSGEWLDIVYFQTWTFVPPVGGLILTGTLDNIVVGNAVPVPAAIWLFGSALAGLGWLRRKQHA